MEGLEPDQVPSNTGVTGSFPYGCQFCDKAFSKLSHLKLHEQVPLYVKLDTWNTMNKYYHTILNFATKSLKIHVGITFLKLSHMNLYEQGRLNLKFGTYFFLICHTNRDMKKKRLKKKVKSYDKGFYGAVRLTCTKLHVCFTFINQLVNSEMCL